VAGVVADNINIDVLFYLSTAVATVGGALVVMGRIPNTPE